MSEIDDIFASKGKTKVVVPTPLPPSALPDTKKKKKKAKKSQSDTDDPPPLSKKRPAPETIIDPSILVATAKRPKTDKSAEADTKMKPWKKDDNNEDRFKDSRGSGPRTFGHSKL